MRQQKRRGKARAGNYGLKRTPRIFHWIFVDYYGLLWNIGILRNIIGLFWIIGILRKIVEYYWIIGFFEDQAPPLKSLF